MCQFAWWTEGTKIKLFGWMYPSSNLQVHYTPLEKRRAQSDVMLRKEKDISEGAALLSFIQHSTIRPFWVVILSLWKWSLFLPFTSKFLADTSKKYTVCCVSHCAKHLLWLQSHNIRFTPGIKMLFIVFMMELIIIMMFVI